METLLASRIQLTPRPLRQRTPVLEYGMLGHCPGVARPERLLSLTAATEAMAAAGFGKRLAQLRAGTGDLEHLPIPLQSGAEFHDIFPQAASARTRYGSVLAGARAWLAGAVDDFFANGGSRLWVVVVPESGGQQAFLPSPSTQLHDVDTLRGLATLLVIPQLGAIALPDLERLQVPSQLPDIPESEATASTPGFLPCSTPPPAVPPSPVNLPESAPTALSPGELLRGLLPWLSRYRPDLQCLLTLPLQYDTQRQIPAADEAALETIRRIRDAADGHKLRQVQFLFPYLRGPGSRLRTACGAIAGLQSATAQNEGPWRSVASRTIVTRDLPFPALPIARQVQLRDDPGVSVLIRRPRGTMLDDERLSVPALPPEDYVRHKSPEQFEAFRSAEIMRFMGYLRRQLQLLGDRLVFNLDFRDPRPRLLLERFLRQLYQQGALRGQLPEQAFQVRQLSSQEGTALFEIMIAPALPIDRLRLTFTNRHGEWQGAVGHE